MTSPARLMGICPVPDPLGGHHAMNTMFRSACFGPV